ncbi:MAG: hypothetical protein KDA85_12365, partial [Planctomycetaceae bacterium]|nr:hypothetical protein [Planctomycetaceae bacterium]
MTIAAIEPTGTQNAMNGGLSPSSVPLESLRAENPATVCWLVVFLLGGLLAMSNSIADPDLWGHVQYGREVLANGELHRTTTWSYAVENYPWINHEVIAELLLAATYNLGGQWGLLLLKSSLGILLLAIPVAVARREGAGLMTALTVVLIISFLTAFHWHLRPHMLSYLCVAVMFGLLTRGIPSVVRERCVVAPADQRRLWLIPPLLIFWVNSHGGYLAGCALLTAWLSLDVADAWLTRHPQARSLTLHRTGLLVVCLAATLINPYGIGLHRWMLSSLG